MAELVFRAEVPEVAVVTAKEGSSVVLEAREESAAVHAFDSAHVPGYSGEYEVVPGLSESTTLPTKGRRMSGDLVVEPVPYYETSNEYGTTIVIG